MGLEDFIHPTALVSPDATLGSGVKVGPYTVIEAGTRIGDGTRIEAFVRIKPGVSVGCNCHIFENVILGNAPQDHDFGGEVSYVRIGDGVVLREGVTVNRATGEGRETVVGSGTLLMEGCHLGHNVRLGAHCTITNKVGFSGHVEVGDYVVVGGLTGFHQFVKVGSYAMVGGLAKITRDVPPYSMVDGHTRLWPERHRPAQARFQPGAADEDQEHLPVALRPAHAAFGGALGRREPVRERRTRCCDRCVSPFPQTRAHPVDGQGRPPNGRRGGIA